MRQDFRLSRILTGLTLIGAVAAFLGGCMFNESRPDVDPLAEELKSAHPAIVEVLAGTNLNGFYYNINLYLTINVNTVEEDLYKTILRTVHQHDYTFNQLFLKFSDQNEETIPVGLTTFSFDTAEISDRDIYTLVDSHVLKKLVESFSVATEYVK